MALKMFLNNLSTNKQLPFAYIAEAYLRVSGNKDQIEKYLENPSIGWSELEDLALKQPEDSAEFQILLAEKGIKKIMERRRFLRATPQLSDMTS